jgi:hypothetical protein
MDRNELLATMYQEDETDEAAQVSIEQGHQRSRKIRVGIIEYEVPTMEYMRHLEQIIMQQAQILAQQRRLITRIENGVHNTRSFVQRQANVLMRELTPKPTYYSE